jgi:hypothetical protein
MTALGATIYGGFFGLAALWLFLTADRGELAQDADHPKPQDADQPTPQDADQPNEPVRSNSVSTADALVGSSPCSASQSSQK